MLIKIMATHETLTIFFKKIQCEKNNNNKKIAFLNTSDFGSKCDE